MTFLVFAPVQALKKGYVTDTNVRYVPRNMPHGIASNGEVSYSVTNLNSALTMLMAVYMYGEGAMKDTKQIALGIRQVGWSIFNDVMLYWEPEGGQTHY
ncbi:hypothetical protein ElyMa_005773800 [Elysia marginata]|uniref:Alpha-1,2-Mannosidase n=1 Tax=Elysia marginata TaxID=1093978 RepID=A0AAV4FQI6_9GAST|nr:hypothetical protein ElyMa_005773800 [Elysia marginata]